MTSRYKFQPRKGDKVWDEHRHQVEKLHPNGVIDYIDWEGKQVSVTFTDGGSKFYDFDELFGNWHEEKFGGTWMLWQN